MLFFIFIDCILFFIGLWGIFITRKNLIIILMALELMLLAINLNFIFISIYMDDMLGQLISLFILTIAAAESSIGLAILIAYFRIRQTINIRFLSTLKN